MAGRKNGEKADKRNYSIEQTFLGAIADGMTITDAAYMAGVSPGAVYAWKKKSAKFAADWAEAHIQGTEALFRAARLRAVDGVEEVVLHNGKPVIIGGKHVVAKRYSDTLLIFLMKARDPFQYCERARTMRLEKELAKKAALEAARADDEAPALRAEAEAAIAMLEEQAAAKAALAKEAPNPE